MSFEDAAAKHRSGGISFKYLSTGVEGTLENYMYAVSGDFSLVPDLVLKEGELAYHPEGVYYGPQDDGPEERILLVLQFGGASGAGLMPLNQIRAANKELAQAGRFEQGKYYADDVHGQKVEPIDGYEVGWTHTAKKSLEYPPGRYERPTIMSPGNSHRKKIGANTFRKLLGVFYEKEVVAQMWRIDEGGSFEVGGNEAIHLVYILQGEGVVGGEKLVKESVVRLWARERCVISSEQTLEALHFAMPVTT